MRQELDYNTRLQIQHLREIKWSYDRIAAHVKKPKSTVRDTCKRFETTGTVQTRPRPGRPRILPLHQVKQAERMVKKHPFTPLQDITNKLGFQCTPETLDKELKERGWHLRIPRKKPFLNAAMKEKRMQWCIERKDWTSASWRNIVWTDEAKVELGKGGPQIRVRRKPGTEYEEQNLLPAFKGGKTSVMIWGAYTYNSLGPIVCVQKRQPHERTSPKDRLGMNATQYINEILNPFVLSYWQHLKNTQPDLLLIENGAGPHKAVTTQKY